MTFEIPAGLKGYGEILVTQERTAMAYGSGLAEVFATPALVALMENTALGSINACLPEGYITVGTGINIRHVKATSVGDLVTCETTLLSQEGKKLVFEVRASDSKGLVGFGEHVRYIVNREEFMNRSRER